MPAGRYEEALARDAYRCQGTRYGYLHRCEGPLEMHHIHNRGMGGSLDPAIHDLENLMTLCRKAHHWVTHHPAAAKELGLAR